VVDDTCSPTNLLTSAPDQSVGLKPVQDWVNAAFPEPEHSAGKQADALDQFVPVHRLAGEKPEQQQFGNAVQVVAVSACG
jgi:hypothetical protein